MTEYAERRCSNMVKEKDETIEYINENSPYQEKPVEKARTTMSVPEMRRLLGLGKTESYWLVHKKVFETILVKGKMRIRLESFEHWYSMQVRYKKVDGPPPGEALRKQSYSAKDIAGLLQLDDTTVYEIIKRDHLETVRVNYQMRVPVEVFEHWYNSQTRYRTQADRERDAELEKDTVSLPEIAWQLGITRREVYAIVNARKNEGLFRFVTVADRKRVVRDSYMRWLNNQDKYHILTQAERDAIERDREKANAPREPKNPNYYTIEEIHDFFGIHRSTVYKWIKEGTIPARRVGSSWRIPREEFEDWIDYRGC
jgi:excisionase family DNA binding protein